MGDMSVHYTTKVKFLGIWLISLPRLSWNMGMCLVWGLCLPAKAQDLPVSDTLEIWYGDMQVFGHWGAPQRWINVLGTVHYLDSFTRLCYSLNSRMQDTLTIGPDLHRLAQQGDFNVDLAWEDLQIGTNTLKLMAQFGSQRHEKTITLIRKEPRFWPLPYAVAFDSVKNLQEVVQVVDGKWILTADGVRTQEPYYDRVLSLGDSSWKDYETFVELTLHGFTPSEPGPPTYNVSHMGVAMRWRGHHEDGRQPHRKWYPLGAQGEFLLKQHPDSCRWRILYDGRGKPPTYAEGRNSLALNRPMYIKTQVRTLADGSTMYRFKQWQPGETEPDAWDVEGKEKGDYPSGALCLVPHNSDVTIHQIRVIPIP